jgi:hypothetical protein
MPSNMDRFPTHRAHGRGRSRPTPRAGRIVDYRKERPPLQRDTAPGRSLPGGRLTAGRPCENREKLTLIDLSAGSLAILVALLAAIVLPGFGVATYLHRGDRFHWTFRAALGFAYSIALFGLLSWPFLWFRGQFQHLLWVLYPTWVVYGLLGAVCFLRGRRAPKDYYEADAAVPSKPAKAASPGQRRAARIVLLGALAVAATFAFIWPRLQPESYPAFLASLGVVLVGMAVAAWRWGGVLAPLVRFTEADHLPAPALWWAVALAAVIASAASAVAYDRPDWDDGYYEAAMLDYESAPALNDQEPVLREGLPVQTAQRALCWELGGAVLCRISGLSPAVLFRTALSGFIVLLAYAAYTGLLGECVPRRWVPLALLGLCAVHAWGISGNYTVIGYLLPRPSQGKTVLAHVAVPLCACLMMRVRARPRIGVGVSLLAVVIFGLTLSLSGIFLLFMLLVVLGTALALCAGRLPFRRLWPAALVLGPILLAGTALRSAMSGVLEGGAVSLRLSDPAVWFSILHGPYAGDGSAEVVWVLTLPLLAALVPRGPAKGYLVIFPILLFLTFGNPLLHDLVATLLTSHATYFRHWWLYPVGPGLAVLLALSARLLSASFGRLSSAWWPLAAAGAGLALSWVLPGLYVWSPRNNYLGTPLTAPHLAENAEKMPAGLLAIARRLSDDPDISRYRILCDLQAASFLGPYSRDFHFVHARWRDTASLLLHAGRPREALERVLLAQLLVYDQPIEPFPPPPAQLSKDVGEAVAAALLAPEVTAEPLPDLAALLARYRVKYVITMPGQGTRSGKVFEECGYRVVLDEGGCQLWQAPKT